MPSVFLEAGFIKALSFFQADVSGGKRIRRLNHVNLLFCMVILHGFISARSYMSLLEIVLSHLRLMILLRSFLWKISMLFSRVCIHIHSSELYMNVNFNEPTCFKGSPSCIDLIITNRQSYFKNTCVTVTGICHFYKLTAVSLRSQTLKAPSIIETIKHLMKIDSMKT